MSFKSIRLQNFKGFRDATLPLKPLTVILGPNSAGKSCFGQALSALSKSNTRDNVLSLATAQGASVDFGKYLDLVHTDCEGLPVKIQLGVASGAVNLGFGEGNIKAGIPELSLSLIETINNTELIKTTKNILSDSVSQTIDNVISETNIDLLSSSFIRENAITWRRKGNSSEVYEFYFNGLDIVRILKLTGTAIEQKNIIPITVFNDLKSLLEKVIYLRPDRLAPLRENRSTPSNSCPKIDDLGGGTDWFIEKFKTNTYKTYFFPELKHGARIDDVAINDLLKQEVGSDQLLVALSKWLRRLGLTDSIDTKLIDGGRAIQTIAAPIGQKRARPISDIGFGVSQVLPILVQGITLEENGTLIVEQPEAQLHPKPQAELADFFCAMVKCNKNVLVETHSEYLFHQLRLRAAMDKDLANKIAIYFISEPEDGICCNPIPISLEEGLELKWPKGFLPNGISIEMAIRDSRKAQRSKGN